MEFRVFRREGSEGGLEEILETEKGVVLILLGEKLERGGESLRGLEEAVTGLRRWR